MYSTFDDYNTFSTFLNKEHYSNIYVDESILVPLQKVQTTFLNLIIYNPGSDYEIRMKDVLVPYLEKQDNVLFYFLVNRDQTEDVMIEDNIMYIKGVEKAVPGILDKTIKAMEWCQKRIQYSYLIRSNISTIINFSKLDSSIFKENYSGCEALNLQWIDEPYGVVDMSLWGTLYIRGIGIFLSAEAVACLIDHKDELEWSIIDDLSIGILLKKYNYTFNKTVGTVHNNTTPNSVCYRNRSDFGGRNKDVERMKKIINMIDGSIKY